MDKKIIYVVDDEKNIRELLQYNLEKIGFIVEVFSNGKDFLDGINKRIPELICLDLMLPDYDGVELCKELKLSPRFSSIPIIMLTAKTSEYDTIIGLEAGADDYIKKPFSINEFLARVRALLRREQKGGREVEEDIIYEGNLSIDLKQRILKVDDVEKKLTLKEFELLLLFVKNKGKVFTREELLGKIWGFDFYGGTRTVDVHIHSLRKIIGEENILTVRGLGYKFNSKEK